MYGYDPDDAGGNMRVLHSTDEATAAAHDARKLYEQQYLMTVHIDLDPRIAERWWPLTAETRN